MVSTIVLALVDNMGGIIWENIFLMPHEFCLWVDLSALAHARSYFNNGRNGGGGGGGGEDVPEQSASAENAAAATTTPSQSGGLRQIICILAAG